MIYEKEIPEYALVPAREAEEKKVISASKGAVYTSIQLTNIVEKPKTIIMVEEDILVPDTKPDLREILMIDGKVKLSNNEIDQISKNEDYVPIAGEIELQTLYLPEKQDMGGAIISVQTRVPFKDQWHTSMTPGSVMTLDNKIEKIEYMVINERKYRVKISFAIYAKEYTERNVDIFEGIHDEKIQMKKETIEITNISKRKKDKLSISQDLTMSDDLSIEKILNQEITVMENYKQLTGEKIIINGFVLVNLLCEGKMQEDDRPVDNIKQIQEKVEFTQFIPIQQGDIHSGCSVRFDENELKVKMVQDEEGKDVPRLEGEITTYVDLYRNIEKEIIVDAYHQEKDFLCDFNVESATALVGTTIGEASVREIISPEDIQGDIDRVIYTTGEIINKESHVEQGKVITEGQVMVKMLCQKSIDKEPAGVISVAEKIPFRTMTSVPQIDGGEIIKDRLHLKDLWAEKINGKQVEVNATVVDGAEILRPVQFKLLSNPAFEESGFKKESSPMVVYVAKSEDTLWKVAKHFKTTTEGIQQLNQIEDEKLTPGEKILILK